MPHGKTQFQPNWLEDDAQDENGDKLLHYIIPDEEDKYRAYCTICSKSVSIANQGKAALIQHARGTIHKEKVKIKRGLSEQRRQGGDSIDILGARPDNRPERRPNYRPESQQLVHEPGLGFCHL